MLDARIPSGQAAAVVDALRGASSVTAICHENPDADTIGAAIAMALLAERLGARAEIVSTDGIPPSCVFLPLADRVHRLPRLEPGLAVVCDAATLERVGRVRTEAAGWLERATVVNIDHHVSNTGWGALNLVDPSAVATCEIVAALMEQAGVELDQPISTALLAGIVRDSHGFADPATTPRSLRTAARLVDAGAPLALVQRLILGELPHATLVLWGRVLGTSGTEGGGRIVHATLGHGLLGETGTRQHDADGVVELLARTRGADVAILFRELPEGTTRVSLRTTETVDAVRLAAEFGGGGHPRRAGFVVEDHVGVVRPRVLTAIAGRLASGAPAIRAGR
ncbi:MAG: DHH family phosphoesterase [Candidatus Limnocylindria bacterium]